MEKKFYYYTTHKNNQPFIECIFTSTRLKMMKKRFTFESKTKINDKELLIDKFTNVTTLNFRVCFRDNEDGFQLINDYTDQRLSL